MIKNQFISIERNFFNDLNPISEGGEAKCYEIEKGILCKIYSNKNKKYLIEKGKQLYSLLKLQESLTKNKRLVIPKKIILTKYTKNENKKLYYPIGIVMKKIEGFNIPDLNNKEFSLSINANLKNILKMLLYMKKDIEFLHENGIVIGDLNENNFIIKNKNNEFIPYMIDCDSWQIGDNKCKVIMPMYKDPNMIGTDFDINTDNFAFMLIAAKVLLRIHPFAGTHLEYKFKTPEQRIPLKAHIIGKKNIILPKNVRNFNMLSDNLLKLFVKFFEGETRIIDNSFEDLYENLSYCKHCNDYFWSKREKCPICNSKGKIIKNDYQKEITDEIDNEINDKNNDSSLKDDYELKWNKIQNKNKYIMNSNINSCFSLDPSRKMSFDIEKYNSNEIIYINTNNDLNFYNFLLLKENTLYLNEKEKIYNKIKLSKNDLYLFSDGNKNVIYILDENTHDVISLSEFDFHFNYVKILNLTSNIINKYRENSKISLSNNNFLNYYYEAGEKKYLYYINMNLESVILNPFNIDFEKFNDTKIKYLISDSKSYSHVIIFENNKMIYFTNNSRYYIEIDNFQFENKGRYILVHKNLFFIDYTKNCINVMIIKSDNKYTIKEYPIIDNEILSENTEFYIEGTNMKLQNNNLNTTYDLIKIKKENK